VGRPQFWFGRSFVWLEHNSGPDLDFLGFILCLEARAGAVVVVTYTLTPEPSSIITSIAKTMRGSIFCSSFNYFP